MLPGFSTAPRTAMANSPMSRKPQRWRSSIVDKRVLRRPSRAAAGAAFWMLAEGVAAATGFGAAARGCGEPRRSSCAKMRSRRPIEASTSSNSRMHASSSFASSAFKSRFSASALAWMALLVSCSSPRRAFSESMVVPSLTTIAAPAIAASAAIRSAVCSKRLLCISGSFNEKSPLDWRAGYPAERRGSGQACSEAAPLFFDGEAAHVQFGLLGRSLHLALHRVRHVAEVVHQAEAGGNCGFARHAGGESVLHGRIGPKPRFFVHPGCQLVRLVAGAVLVGGDEIALDVLQQGGDALHFAFIARSEPARVVDHELRVLCNADLVSRHCDDAGDACRNAVDIHLNARRMLREHVVDGEPVKHISTRRIDVQIDSAHLAKRRQILLKRLCSHAIAEERCAHLVIQPDFAAAAFGLKADSHARLQKQESRPMAAWLICVRRFMLADATIRGRRVG